MGRATVIAALLVAATVASGFVHRLQEQSLLLADGEEGTSGYFKLNRTFDAHLFYQLYPSRGSPATDPLLLWMTGGPGCSSALALYYENGPVKINDDAASVRKNPYSWNSNATVVWVDQPVNVGFSYSEDGRDDVIGEAGVAADMVDFIQSLLAAHPELTKLDFFVVGESYGGHYVPAVSHAVWHLNKLAPGPQINLKGLAIGNGVINPGIQLSAYKDYALENGLIGQPLHDLMEALYPSCKFLTDQCNEHPWVPFLCAAADTWCTATEWQPPLTFAGRSVNIYDIRKPCIGELCYDFSLLEKYLNNPDVQAQLGVHRRFVETNWTVNMDFKNDLSRRFDLLLPPMLADGIRVLMYHGVGERVLDALPWAGALHWAQAAPLPWGMPGSNSTAGTFRSTDGVTFVKVKDAGHLVPMDQPEAALELINRFIAGKGLRQPAALARPGGQAAGARDSA